MPDSDHWSIHLCLRSGLETLATDRHREYDVHLPPRLVHRQAIIIEEKVSLSTVLGKKAFTTSMTSKDFICGTGDIGSR